LQLAKTETAKQLNAFKCENILQKFDGFKYLRTIALICVVISYLNVIVNISVAAVIDILFNVELSLHT